MRSSFNLPVVAFRSRYNSLELPVRVCGRREPGRDRVGARGSRLQLPVLKVPAQHRQARGGAKERRGPFKSRALAGSGAAGAQSAARRSGVGSGRKSFLPTPASRAAAAAHSSPGPGAGPATVARARAKASAGPGRAEPTVSLWRSSSSRLGRARAAAGGAGHEPSSPATGHLGGSPSRRRPLLDSHPPAASYVGGRGAAASPCPRGVSGERCRAPGPPAPGHPPSGGCIRGARHLSVGPGAVDQSQDESNCVLRQDGHRGALQRGPAARPGAHPAGAAAVPKDPGKGEPRAVGVQAGPEKGGAAAARATHECPEASAPARCSET
ncbi:hypothetical protein GHT09_009391 [Marmota monax]|uniref:Uncharacterized protein n=1 Tax=Marmota monax TaxID=9995 RepID=A0A834V0P0_MARMO|nr:hypothetical protein GHT09_009391 [Marmota monax]